MSDKVTLKPCPFCGGEVELRHDHTTEDIDTIHHAKPSSGCPLDAGVSAFLIGNEELAAAWNTRASQQSVPNSVVEAGKRLSSMAAHEIPLGTPVEEFTARDWENLALALQQSAPTTLQQSGQTEAELLREARDALEPFGNPDILMQIAEDDDEEWAKFRLLVSDYRRAGRALARLNATQGEGA